MMVHFENFCFFFRKPLALPLDLLIPGNMGMLVNKTIEEFGEINVLFNNAGVIDVATIQDPNFRSVYEATKAINQEVPVELTRLAAPYMKASNRTIVFTASIAARNPVSEILFPSSISS